MNSRTRDIIEAIYTRYHKPEYLGLDPIEYVRAFSDPADIEIAGLLASSLAYGMVETIRSSVRSIFAITGKNINDFVRSTSFTRKQIFFRGFKHRFNDGFDISLFFECLRPALEAHGSLQGLFHEVNGHGDETIERPLNEFVRRLKNWAVSKSRTTSKSFDHLLPLPEQGSACKRLNMYLRWMVRDNDGIDLGIWKTVSPARLIIPVDTHVAKAARRLHLTTRTTVDWRMAEEITGQLKKIDPSDPVKYDFSLCRWGMTDARLSDKRNLFHGKKYR
jgi:uncharacterized protein (TIGR02757 family)